MDLERWFSWWCSWASSKSVTGNELEMPILGPTQDLLVRNGGGGAWQSVCTTSGRLVWTDCWAPPFPGDPAAADLSTIVWEHLAKSNGLWTLMCIGITWDWLSSCSGAQKSAGRTHSPGGSDAGRPQGASEKCCWGDKSHWTFSTESGKGRVGSTGKAGRVGGSKQVWHVIV